MPRSLSPEFQEALKARALFPVYLVSIYGKAKADVSVDVIKHYITYSESVSVKMINPRTNVEETRVFEGNNNLLSVGKMDIRSGLSLSSMTMRVAIGDPLTGPLDYSTPYGLVRNANVNQCHVEVFFGLMSNAGSVLLDVPQRLFLGQLDGVSAIQGGDAVSYTHLTLPTKA